VKNTGAEAWPSKGRDEKNTWKVGLCYRWFDQAGKPVKDTWISSLRNDLLPGLGFTTDATIEAPDKIGEWTLHITMFQDGVAWFDGKGGVPLVMSVKVEAK
jgi:hypothetical protein